jgi:SagB-type dehydrogenase family enzyme
MSTSSPLPTRVGVAVVTETLALRADAQAVVTPEGVTALVEGHVRAPLGKLGPALTAAVAALATGAQEEQLIALTTEAEGEMAVLKLQMMLRRLDQGGWLARTVSADGVPLATRHPVGHAMPPQPPPADLAGPMVLSRFACLRAEGGVLRVESPLHAAYAELHAPALGALVARLAQPVQADELADSVPGLEPAAVRPILRLLRDAAVVTAGGAPEPPGQAQWSFADLLFHARSRVGRNLGGFGGTYHREGTAEPLPAVKPPRPSAVVLPKPDLAAVTADDPPFGEVLERRRSIRVHDDAQPITVAELGELLYRAARVRGVMHDGHQELSSRPYPGGGACYELELYPLVNLCEGIAPALYHYDPSGHTLGLVAEPGPPTILLDEYSRMTAVMDTSPQVVLLIAARFGRVMWKYESMAYALVLKQVGVLYQTLYLTATAMGLAACALGGGNSDAFCTAAGVDFCEETTVGEFVIGRPGATPGAPVDA